MTMAIQKRYAVSQNITFKELGKLIRVDITGEIGFTRYLKAIYENGYLTYEYDLKKNNTKNHRKVLTNPE
jgi:uncharacterized protein YbcV (DUF1398 family)